MKKLIYTILGLLFVASLAWGADILNMSWDAANNRATLQTKGDGSGGTSASSDVKYVRKLNTIFLQVPQALATTGTSSTTLTSNIGVPIWARSSVSQRFGGVLVGENGSRLATQGMIDFNTNGTFTIYRGSNTPINWTNTTANSGHVSGNPVVFTILR